MLENNNDHYLHPDVSVHLSHPFNYSLISSWHLNRRLGLKLMTIRMQPFATIPKETKPL